MSKLTMLWLMQCLHMLMVTAAVEEQQVGLAPYEFGAAEVKRHETNNLPPFWANRGRRDEEFGPFWANRGKRTDGLAPSDGWQRSMREARAVCLACASHHETRLQEPFYVEEPHWILVRRDDQARTPDGPFFVTRGKKRAPSERPATDAHPGRYE